MYSSFMQVHTCGVSSLDHELLDDSVEDVSIVVAIGSMHTEVLHRLGAAAHGNG